MHTFLKEERLCGETLISDLFHNGSSFVLYPFRVFYLQGRFEQVAAKVLISVPKRRFKRAVDRNLLKRRIRESYRLNKGSLLYPFLSEHNLRLYIGLNYIGREIAEYALIEKKLKAVLQKLVAACHAIEGI